MKSHDEAVIAMLREDPAMALDYLRAAFDELDEPGGESAFLMALRHVVDAQGGVAAIAQRAEVSRESLYRALSPKGNPTLRTMSAVIKATGIRFHDLTHPTQEATAG
ncbi:MULTISPECIES: addiction module antidote protein [Halomonadaceae]|uniref:addiction module antidote protein n=1 Tax=Halomonadaceae TaxID=28256 RepID=UPI0009BF45BD|nr:MULTISPECIES: addiction module antidote protein [unclassified Halomonas]